MIEGMLREISFLTIGHDLAESWLGAPPQEASMHGEVCLWQDLYHAFFDRNVAGAIVTDSDGKILNCNDACARIFGFGSRVEMLAHTAWDFYFDKQDRLDLLERLKSRVDCRAEEVCLRRSDGNPVWVLTSRSTLLNGKHCPEYFQGTLIDISARKLLEQRPNELDFATSDIPFHNQSHSYESEFATKVSRLLRTLNEGLQPANLFNMEKIQIQETLRTLEAIKMFLIDLEILRLR